MGSEDTASQPQPEKRGRLQRQHRPLARIRMNCKYVWVWEIARFVMLLWYDSSKLCIACQRRGPLVCHATTQFLFLMPCGVRNSAPRKNLSCWGAHCSVLNIPFLASQIFRVLHHYVVLGPTVACCQWIPGTVGRISRLTTSCQVLAPSEVRNPVDL